ncbi:polysaccharide biosynthesis/export family protein [Sphingomonas sp. PL20]|uniref:polysaccharide biosynthesis/export family protein n=1 Tax=Sphingomonas sp. PL20 TaxID=2760712 RepID=UPI001AE9678D
MTSRFLLAATLNLWVWTGVPAAAQSPTVGATKTAPTQAVPETAVAPSSSSYNEDYKLGVADKVRIIVFDEPTLSGEFLVNANGSLSLPLIGDVRAENMTPTEVTQEIRTKLMDGYVREPRVSIDILTFRPFYIFGEVNKPGEYPFSAGLTVENAAATAGGFTYRADKKKVFIKHAGETESIRQKLTPDLKVRAGDTIRIGERYF